MTKKPASMLGEGNTRGYSFAPPEMLYTVPECKALDVGHVVDIKGSLSTFRKVMTMQIIRVNILHSTEEEVALWERRTSYYRDVLEQPWVLTERQIRKCRKEAEEDERVREKERRRDAARAAKAAAEANVDGFGRPKGPQPARSLSHTNHKGDAGLRTAGVPPEEPKPSEPVFDGFGRLKGERGAHHPKRARDQSRIGAGSSVRPKSVPSTKMHDASGEESEPSKPEFDGFGRPSGRKSARKAPHLTTITEVLQPNKKHRNVDKVEILREAPELPGPELDGFGKPKRHKPVHRTSLTDQAPEVKKPHIVKAADAPRNGTDPSEPRLDGFGNPVRPKLTPRALSSTTTETRETGRQHREPRTARDQSGAEGGNREGSNELDGFGRPKSRHALKKPVVATKPPQKRPVQAVQAEMVAPRGPVAEVTSSGVELDGFGRPKRPKRPA